MMKRLWRSGAPPNSQTKAQTRVKTSAQSKQSYQVPISNTDDGVVRVSAQSLIALYHGAQSLSLKPKKIRSLQGGGYISPFKGRGMEFDEARPYMPGDDVRTLDWRVTARTGKPHTKLFREERERAVLLWTDLRQSMFFATQGAFKAVRAAQAAALLGWSAIHHGDRLGALIFSEEEHKELRPKRGKQSLLHLFKQLAEAPAWNRQQSHYEEQQSISALHQSLVRMRRVAQPGSLIFLLSDFALLDEQAKSHIVQLARHNDLVLISLYDPLESELPPAGRYRVSDGEAFFTMDTSPANARDHYTQRFAWQQAELLNLCRRYGMFKMSMSTAEDPLNALQKGMGGRR